MNEIVFTSQPMDAAGFQRQCGYPLDELLSYHGASPAYLPANTPYLRAPSVTPADRALLGRFGPLPVCQELSRFALSFGGETAVAFADLMAKTDPYNVGLMGAATSVYAERIGGFAGAVKTYQTDLMAYHEAVKSGSASQGAARQRAVASFERMQRGFRNEMNAVTGKLNARYKARHPLHDPLRATNIARSSRRVTKLHLMNQVQATNLVKLSRHAKMLGNGLAVIDFAGRAGNVINTHREGGQWEREMFNESLSFALSASAGIATVKAGGAALTFLVAATPVGWVGLLVGGLVVTGAAAAISITTNAAVKKRSGSLYDAIMAWLN